MTPNCRSTLDGGITSRFHLEDHWPSAITNERYAESTFVMGIMAAALLLTGCGKTSNTLAERAAKDVGKSQVVGYATAATGTTTNILLTVTEIWKGSEEASRLGITNGMQFSKDDPAGRLPDGAVFSVSVDTNLQPTEQSYYWVRSGRVGIGNMTVQEFRAKIGL
jgi:hypothetical protein